MGFTYALSPYFSKLILMMNNWTWEWMLYVIACCLLIVLHVIEKDSEARKWA